MTDQPARTLIEGTLHLQRYRPDPSTKRDWQDSVNRGLKYTVTDGIYEKGITEDEIIKYNSSDRGSVALTDIWQLSWTFHLAPRTWSRIYR